MSREQVHSTPSAGKIPPRNRSSRFPSLPIGLLAGQLAALLLLALVTSWLLQRGDSRETASQMQGRARWTAELVAQAVGGSVTLQDSPRLLPVLERATRDAQLQAAAILDTAGTIVAHTNVTRTGLHLALPTDPHPSGEELAKLLGMRLFGKDANRVLIHPLLGADAAVGTLVLQMPNPKGGLRALNPEAFLPIAVLLLAYVGLTQATVRRAIAPTSAFLERLARSLHSPDTSDKDPGDHSYGKVMDDTVSFVDAMRQAKESLTIENRLLGYERKRMEKILDLLPDGILMMDRGGELSYVNRAAVAMLSLSSENVSDRHAPQLPEECKESLAEAERSGRATLSRSADNQDRTLVITRIPMPSTSGRSAGTLYTLRDTTAQHSAERAQTEFLSQVAHELKAPLNTIVTYVEALADDTLLSADERRDFYNTLNGEAHRMGQLISNLLQLSRIGMGNLTAKFGFVKLGDLLRVMGNSLRAQAEGQGLTFQLQVPDNLPSIQGDKDLLGVAITNLITNAIKYTPAGGRISILAAEEEGGIRLEVSDTGLGIPEEFQQKAFERFARSEQEEVQQKSGSGLGLSLVKEIADIHDGRIELTSTVGQGSTFRIWLPVRETDSHLSVPAA
jgi:two-component system, OmpR family, phosphate regulon sensor histidine kinase PhoR